MLPNLNSIGKRLRARTSIVTGEPHHYYLAQAPYLGLLEDRLNYSSCSPLAVSEAFLYFVSTDSEARKMLDRSAN